MVGAGLCVSLIGVLGVLFLLDKSLVAKTASQRELVSRNDTTTTRTGNTQVDAMFLNTGATGSNSALGNGINADALRQGNIGTATSAATAKAALRNATAESIQTAVQTRTGRTVSVSNIERARTSALSSDSQKKINEALKRRDEVDMSTIREKLKQY